MFKEGKINEKQKGQLKYLVLENNQNLIKCLEGYLASGDKEDLHREIIAILENEEVEESLENSALSENV